MKNKVYKVCFVHHGEVLGGAPKSLKNLVLDLSKYTDIDVTVCCAYNSMIEFFSGSGFKVKKYPKPCKISGKVFIGLARFFNPKTFFLFFIEVLFFPLTIFRELLFLLREKPDIVHLNSSVLWSSAIAAYLLGIPIIWHIRENFSGITHNPIRRLYRSFIEFVSAHIICISPSEMESAGFARNNRISVIYNGVDIRSFCDSVICGHDLGSELSDSCCDRCVILSLGGISFHKGAFQLIETMKYLDDSFKLVIAGDKSGVPDSNTILGAGFIISMENWLVKAGLKKCYSWFYSQRVSRSLKGQESDKIYLAGMIDNIQELIQSCDILVFAGTTPHFGRPIYEAWLLKKPVVAFRNKVMEKEIDHMVDGILVDDYCSEKLAEAIIYLKNNTEVAARMADCGYDKAINRFDQEKNTIKVKAIYEKILNGYCQ